MQLFTLLYSLSVFMKIIFLLAITFLFGNTIGHAQLYIEPIVGGQISLNNTDKNFFQVNVGLQLAIHKDRFYEMLIRAMAGLPVSSTIDAAKAYTANPSLPISADVSTSIKPYTYSFALGHRITINSRKTQKNNVFLIIFTGFVNERIAVHYAYDKSNYTILNPQISLGRVSVFASAGLEYMKQLANGRLFANILIATPPIGKKTSNLSTFTFIIPLSVNVGYSIPLSKKK